MRLHGEAGTPPQRRGHALMRPGIGRHIVAGPGRAATQDRASHTHRSAAVTAAPKPPVARRTSWRHAWLLPALACLLAACGGGGGADDNAAAETLLASPGRATAQQTDRNLDLAIFGDGMFPFIDAQGRRVYSRTARLGLDLENRLVNADGAWLAGVQEGKSTPGQPQALAAVPMTIPALTSSTVRMSVSLQACLPEPNAAEPAALQAVGAPSQFVQASSGLNPLPLVQPGRPGRVCSADTTPLVPGWYFGAAYSMSAGIYDADGRQRGLTLYFRDMGNTSWEVYATVDGEPVWAPDAQGQPVAVLRFNMGQLDPATARWMIEWPAEPLKAAGTTNTLELDLTGSTYTVDPFGTKNFERDGYPTGKLLQIVVDGDDLIRLRYDNGQERIHGRMLLAQFSVADRLRAVGQSGWLCEQHCAGPRFAMPTTLLTGQVRSGYLEPTIR